MTETHLFTSEQKLSYWGYGEWVEEADEVHWHYKDIRCEIIRNASLMDGQLIGLGHLCGYIILPKEHPWEHVESQDIDAEVHGGITHFSDNQDGLIKIGFDCAHYRDEIPYTAEKGLRFMMSMVEKDSEEYFKYREVLEKIQNGPTVKFNSFMMEKKTYRNIGFVKFECEKLADQAIEALKAHPPSDLPQDLPKC
jgi:hypothetical protein